MTTDPLIETLTSALESHNFADADTCACGVEYDGQVTYERHQAEVYLAAIAATGRLLPDGGAVVIATTEAAGGFDERTERGFRWPDGQVVPIGDAVNTHDATPVRRSVYLGPWEPTQPEHGAST